MTRSRVVLQTSRLAEQENAPKSLHRGDCGETETVTVDLPVVIEDTADTTLADARFDAAALVDVDPAQRNLLALPRHHRTEDLFLLVRERERDAR